MLLAQVDSSLRNGESAVQRGNNSYHEILDMIATLQRKYVDLIMKGISKF